MTSTIQYNMERIREIIDECNWSLSEKVQSIFQELDKLIVVEDEDLNAVPLKRNDRSFDRFKNKKRFYKSSSKSSSLNNMNIEDWEAIRNFKPTEKAEISDFDKNIGLVENSLNEFKDEARTKFVGTQKNTQRTKHTKGFYAKNTKNQFLQN